MRRRRYWEVQSAYYDDGRVIANIMKSALYEKKPETRYTELRRCDVYVEYFPSLAAAQQWVRDSRMA